MPVVFPNNVTGGSGVKLLDSSGSDIDPSNPLPTGFGSGTFMHFEHDVTTAGPTTLYTCPADREFVIIGAQIAFDGTGNAALYTDASGSSLTFLNAHDEATTGGNSAVGLLNIKLVATDLITATGHAGNTSGRATVWGYEFVV